MKNHKVYGVIAGAGSGSRAKQNKNKMFSIIDGETVIYKTVKTFDNSRHVDEIIVIYRDGELEEMQNALLNVNKPITYVLGGETRFQSVKNALKTLDDGIVLIHDGARPFIYIDSIEKCVLSVLRYGSGVLGAPLTETVMDTDGNGNIL